MAKYVEEGKLLEYLIYFDQKQTKWFSEHYVPKQTGMSLISNTTLTAIVNHLTEVKEAESDTDTTTITTALDDYFRKKTVTLSGGSGT